MNSIPKRNEIYKHFKGNFYKVLMLATDSETEKEVVVYQALYGEGKVYVRPLEMFMSEVDREKYPDVEQKYRFERQESAIDPGVLDFLDAESCEDKLNILSRLQNRITDDMINTMALSMDFSINTGSIEERYEELRNCILTRARFEDMRLRS